MAHLLKYEIYKFVLTDLISCFLCFNTMHSIPASLQGHLTNKGQYKHTRLTAGNILTDTIGSCIQGM